MLTLVILLLGFGDEDLSAGFSLVGFSQDYPYLLSVFPFTPAKEYAKPDLQKKDILSDNKDKSGIYCWFNTVNGNFYIGSSSSLKTRFVHYYSPS